MSKILSYILIGIVGIFLMLTAIALFYSQNGSNAATSEVTEAMKTELVDLLNSHKQGSDFSAEAVRAEQIARESRGTGSFYNKALSIAAESNFMTAEEGKRVKAVQISKLQYLESQGKPQLQAIEVNRLLAYINAGYEKYIFNEVFKDEPFAQFLVPGDMVSSVRNLAEHSLSLDPSTAAQFRIGQWYADRIRDTHGTWGATDAQKKEYADAILRIIDASMLAIPGEQIKNSGAIFDFMLMPRYYFWHTYLYAAVARVYPEYLLQTKGALEELVATYENSKGENGEKIPLIASRLPYGYMAYALALHDVQGEKANDEIKKILDALIAIIEKNPSVHEGAFLSVVKQGAKPELPDRTKGVGVYIDLAEIHQPFKDFLIKHGWNFPRS